ncbi:MAG: hypothetical protein ACLP66_21975 [Polyangia bacterium]
MPGPPEPPSEVKAPGSSSSAPGFEGKGGDGAGSRRNKAWALEPSAGMGAGTGVLARSLAIGIIMAIGASTGALVPPDVAIGTGTGALGRMWPSAQAWPPPDHFTFGGLAVDSLRWTG